MSFWTVSSVPADPLFLGYARKKKLTSDQPITRYGLNEGHVTSNFCLP